MQLRALRVKSWAQWGSARVLARAIRPEGHLPKEHLSLHHDSFQHNGKFPLRNFRHQAAKCILLHVLAQTSGNQEG